MIKPITKDILFLQQKSQEASQAKINRICRQQVAKLPQYLSLLEEVF